LPSACRRASGESDDPHYDQQLGDIDDFAAMIMIKLGQLAWSPSWRQI
jgi:hypothetical protein